jgi:tRNA threonylcarbamoyladenosine biosynthesis protein TsaB
MKILGIDTTRKIARMFIYDDETNYKNFIEVNENIKHSEGVFLYLEKLLNESKCMLKDFDAFCGIVGPGSFTGIRVGMSVIKGFNKCLNKKIISINTFELLKDCVKNGIVLLNSTSSSCYYAKIKNKTVSETGVIEKKCLLDFANNEDVYILKEEQYQLNIEYNNTVVIDNICDYYIPALLQKFKENIEDEFVPYYIQLSQAERNVKND